MDEEELMIINCDYEVNTVYALGTFWFFPHTQCDAVLDFYSVRTRKNLLKKLFDHLEEERKRKGRQ